MILLHVPFFFSVLPTGLRQDYICCKLMLIVQKLNKTVFGTHICCPWGVRREGCWRHKRLEEGRRASIQSSQAQAPARHQPEQCLSSASNAARGLGPTATEPWSFLLVATQANSKAHCTSILCTYGRPLQKESPWTRTLLVAAAHSGRKLEYFLNNMHFIWDHCITGLNPCLGQFACSKITPKPRNNSKKRILNVFFFLI